MGTSRLRSTGKINYQRRCCQLSREQIGLRNVEMNCNVFSKTKVKKVETIKERTSSGGRNRNSAAFFKQEEE